MAGLWLGGSLLPMKKFFASFLLGLLCVCLLSVLFLHLCRCKDFFCLNWCCLLENSSYVANSISVAGLISFGSRVQTWNVFIEGNVGVMAGGDRTLKKIKVKETKKAFLPNPCRLRSEWVLLLGASGRTGKEALLWANATNFICKENLPSKPKQWKLDNARSLKAHIPSKTFNGLRFICKAFLIIL